MPNISIPSSQRCAYPAHYPTMQLLRSTMQHFLYSSQSYRPRLSQTRVFRVRFQDISLQVSCRSLSGVHNPVDTIYDLRFLTSFGHIIMEICHLPKEMEASTAIIDSTVFSCSYINLKRLVVFPGLQGRFPLYWLLISSCFAFTSGFLYCFR